MDRLTRNALIVSALLLMLLTLSLTWNRFDLRPRIWQLNAILENDPVLKNYPYHFRALLFQNGIVTLSSPHASERPVEPFLKAIDPALANPAPAGAELAMEAARARLWRQELHAIALMTAQPDVDAVVWSLDRAWYRRHGLPLK